MNKGQMFLCERERQKANINSIYERIKWDIKFCLDY